MANKTVPDSIRERKTIEEALKKAKKKFHRFEWYRIVPKDEAKSPYPHSPLELLAQAMREDMKDEIFKLYIDNIDAKFYVSDSDPLKYYLNDRTWTEIYLLFDIVEDIYSEDEESEA